MSTATREPAPPIGYRHLMRRALLLVVLCTCKPAAVVITPPAAPVAIADPGVATSVTPVDRDDDGIDDGSDRCPDEPEDLDQFEDGDGCVDRDNDGDKILDADTFVAGRWTNCDYQLVNDAVRDCRNQPEDFDGFRDHDGCPDFLCFSQCPLKLPETLHLDRHGKLPTGAAKALDAVAATMRAVPDVDIRVVAHLDSRRDAGAAGRVTLRVAGEVVAALVDRGIARERLTPVGYGSLIPIADDRTAAGRAANRRVEFVLPPCGCDSPAPPKADVPQVCR